MCKNIDFCFDLIFICRFYFILKDLKLSQIIRSVMFQRATYELGTCGTSSPF